jgi:hypothetical protein
MNGRIPLLMIGWVAGACAAGTGAPSAPRPAPAAPVDVSGPRGNVASARLHNEPTPIVLTVAAPLDTVWRALPGAYATVGIPDPGIDPGGAKAVGNLSFHPHRLAGHMLSEYLDCGRGITAVPRADEYDVTMSVRTDLRPGPEGATVATTTVQATAQSREMSANAVYCRSLGTLEARIVLVLRTAVGAR